MQKGAAVKEGEQLACNTTSIIINKNKITYILKQKKNCLTAGP
jgi:hypothetical protein